MSVSTICLVTSRHLCYNPRLLKEADALHGAGYEVRVVALNVDKEKETLDQEIMRERTWPLDTLEAQQGGAGRWRWLYTSLRQRLFRAAPLRFFESASLTHAYSRYGNELAAKAAAHAADLYIAHNLQALPAASRAAAKRGARLGFDAEDFHRGELPEDGSRKRRLTEQIEARYIPRCDYLTAASDGIAEAYAEALNIDRPTTILNVFPRSERDGHTPAGELEQEKPSDAISLYWYSQVIGSDRGLQDVLRALPQVDERVQLSLRGTWAKGFQEEFMQLARRLGVAHRVHHLPPASPEQLVERAAQHDVGLALEPGKDGNNQIAVSNKLLAYLLAGVPVVATDTQGQRGICEALPEATRLCTIGDSAALAEAVQSLLCDEETHRAAREAAWKAGEERYNWNVEKQKFLKTVRSSIELIPTTA